MFCSTGTTPTSASMLRRRFRWNGDEDGNEDDVRIQERLRGGFDCIVDYVLDECYFAKQNVMYLVRMFPSIIFLSSEDPDNQPYCAKDENHHYGKHY